MMKNKIYVKPTYVEQSGDCNIIDNIIAKLELEFHRDDISHQMEYMFDVIKKSDIYNNLTMKPSQFFFDVRHKFNADNVKDIVTLTFDKRQYSFGFVCNHIAMPIWLTFEAKFSLENSSKFINLCHKFMEVCKFDRFGYFGDPFCDHLKLSDAYKQWQELKENT